MLNTTPGHRFSGGKLDLLRRIAWAGLSRTNASRNLHSLINKNKILFPVEIDACLIHVAFRKPTFRREEIWWPIIRMESWVKTILHEVPEVLLGGFKLEHVKHWSEMLHQFWKLYFSAYPGHCLKTSGFDHGFCIPYFFHGDEGRGYRNRPVMIESFQPVISHKGPLVTNESGCL